MKITPLVIDTTDPWNLDRTPLDGVAVVIDLFRATSSIQILVDRGFLVRPRRNPSEVHAGQCHLVGEWYQATDVSFTCGNSPIKLLGLFSSKEPVEFVSSNGSGALFAASVARRTFCGSLFNIQALTELLAAIGEPVHLIPAGRRGDRRLEDDFTALMIAERLSFLKECVFTERLNNLHAAINGTNIQDLMLSPGATFVSESGDGPDLEFILSGRYKSTVIPEFRNNLIKPADAAAQPVA
ncbi:MAG: 2-phosphosulfolactate phosphatase [Candidatus Micrarchaeaceae archaeon]